MTVESEVQGLGLGEPFILISCQGQSGSRRRKVRPADYVAERERMVRRLIQEGLLRSPDVIDGMKKVPREMFLAEHLRPYAYSDTPLPTEHGQTISAPHGRILPGDTWSP